MAFAPVIARLNNTCKINAGNRFWCFGVLTFGASDTYVTGGMVAPTSDYLQQIRRLFGVGEVEAIIFQGHGSQNSGTATEPSGAQASFVATTKTLKLYRIGRAEDSATVADAATEIANGEAIDKMRFEFKAIARQTGTSTI